MLGIVAFGLFVSGVTIWPAIPELALALRVLEWLGLQATGLHAFLSGVAGTLEMVNRDYPYVMYGYDWLAFAHICLAVLFAGAMRDPAKNLWVVQCGLLMCAGVPVLAAICIPLRGIPAYWFLVDAAFAPGAAIPLFIALRDIRAGESPPPSILKRAS